MLENRSRTNQSNNEQLSIKYNEIQKHKQGQETQTAFSSFLEIYLVLLFEFSFKICNRFSFPFSGFSHFERFCTK